MTDFNKVKAEYIAGGITLRELSEKYKISLSNLKKKAANEKWSELRTEAEQKTNEEIIAAVAKKGSKSCLKTTEKINKICNELLDSIYNNFGDFTGTPKNCKAVSDILKNINEIVGQKTNLDIKEQKLLIKKLKKEISAEKTDNSIKIEISGADAERFSG